MKFTDIIDLSELINKIKQTPIQAKLVFAILSILMLLSSLLSGMDAETIVGIKTLFALAMVCWLFDNPPDIILNLSN